MTVTDEKLETAKISYGDGWEESTDSVLLFGSRYGEEFFCSPWIRQAF
jgi:hypothetical protein